MSDQSILESIIIFTPYFCIRLCFPKTYVSVKPHHLQIRYFAVYCWNLSFNRNNMQHCKIYVECINNDNTIFSYVLQYKDIILNKRKFKMKVEEVFWEISQDIKNPTRWNTHHLPAVIQKHLKQLFFMSSRRLTTS